jgi:hypothetical protein
MKENLDLLVEAISERMKREGYECFYIGKTNDIERRREEHQKEGFNETFVLAKGKPVLISKYETELIKECKNKKLKIENKEEFSTGNENALYLYVSFKHKIEDISELYNDTFLLSNDFPINLTK